MSGKIKVGAEITGDASSLKKAASEASKSVAAFNKEARRHSKEVEQSFKNVTIALAKIGGAILIAKKGFEILSQVMKTSEGGSDKLEEAIGGVKEGYFELTRALSTGDLSNFFNNLKEGVIRGKELTKALDDLADRTAYNDYILQGLKGEKALLEETVKDKTLELSVRAAAADKVIAIAEKIQKREEELALKAFLIQKRTWEGRNKMTTEEAIKLYETIDNLSSSMEDQLAKGFAYSTKLFGDKGIGMVLSGEKGRGLLKGISEEVIQSYGKYLQLLESGEADVLPKLFTTHKNYLQTITDAQNEYNGTLRTTTALLDKQDKILDKSFNKIAGPSKAPTSNLTMPSFSTMALAGLQGPPEAQIKSMADALQIATYATNELQNAFESLFTSTGISFKSMADSMISSIERLVAELAARAAVFLILKTIFPELWVASGMSRAGGLGNFLFPSVGKITGVSPKIGSLGGSQNIALSGQFKFNGKDLFLTVANHANMLDKNT